MRGPAPFADPDRLMLMLYYLDPETEDRAGQGAPMPIGISHSDGADHLVNPGVLDAWGRVAPVATAAPVDRVGFVVSGPMVEDLIQLGIARTTQHYRRGDYAVRLDVRARWAIRDGARTVAEVLAVLNPPAAPSSVQITMRDNHGAVTGTGSINQTINNNQHYRTAVSALTALGFSADQAFDLAQAVQDQVAETGQAEPGPGPRSLLERYAVPVASSIAGTTAGQLVEQALPILGDWGRALADGLGHLPLS